MASGSIKKLIFEKGFGFITDEHGVDWFFHQSGVTARNFDDLRVGQRVTFTEGQGPKGPRAEAVVPTR